MAVEVELYVNFPTDISAVLFQSVLSSDFIKLKDRNREGRIAVATRRSAWTGVYGSSRTNGAYDDVGSRAAVCWSDCSWGQRPEVEVAHHIKSNPDSSVQKL